MVTSRCTTKAGLSTSLSARRLLQTIFYSLQLFCFFVFATDGLAQKLKPGTTKEVDINYLAQPFPKRVEQLYSTVTGVYAATVNQVFENYDLYKIESYQMIGPQLRIDAPLLPNFNGCQLQYQKKDSLYILETPTYASNVGLASSLDFFQKIFLASDGRFACYYVPFAKKAAVNSYVFFDLKKGNYFSFFNKDTINGQKMYRTMIGRARLYGKRMVHMSDKQIFDDIDDYLRFGDREFITNQFLVSHKPVVFFHDTSIYSFSFSERGVRVIDTSSFESAVYRLPELESSNWCGKYYYDPILGELYTLIRRNFRWVLREFDWQSRQFVTKLELESIDPAVFCINNGQLYYRNKKSKRLQVVALKQVDDFSSYQSGESDNK